VQINFDAAETPGMQNRSRQSNEPLLRWSLR
jgi:hypothetical protein